MTWPEHVKASQPSKNPEWVCQIPTFSASACCNMEWIARKSHNTKQSSGPKYRLILVTDRLTTPTISLRHVIFSETKTPRMYKYPANALRVLILNVTTRLNRGLMVRRKPNSTCNLDKLDYFRIIHIITMNLQPKTALIRCISSCNIRQQTC